MDLESKRPAGPLFRVGRDDDAWAVPDWAYAKEDGTFGNRFDDPMGVYRVLYASSQWLGCFIETLARFRVEVTFVADLALMENGEDDFTAIPKVIARICSLIQAPPAGLTPINGHIRIEHQEKSSDEFVCKPSTQIAVRCGSFVYIAVQPDAFMLLKMRV